MFPFKGGTSMPAIFKTSLATLAAAFVVATIAGAASAQEIKRTEVKRSDLTGTNMEVIMSIVEIPPGAVLQRHFHYGEEAFYVLEGAMTELPGPPPQGLARAPGTGGINVREVPHAGYKVVGDKPLKLLTVHVVDKGKPLAVNVP
jgi:oxalate decarboxylase/phosphoglucose isomerase-like protein (cupin superfamily)